MKNVFLVVILVLAFNSSVFAHQRTVINHYDEEKDWTFKGGLEAPHLIKFNDKASVKAYLNHDMGESISKGNEAGVVLVLDWSILNFSK